MLTVKSYLFCFLAVFILLFSVLGQQKARATVRIGWTNQVDLAKIAQVNGAYRKALGESIDWKQYDDDFQMLHDLAVEKLDIAPIGLIPFVSAVTSGLQVRIIAISSQFGTDSGLVIRNQSNINNPQALVGKKIAVPFLTTSHYSLLKALQHWNLDNKQVQLVNMPVDKIVKSWNAGEIDGAYVEGVTFLNFKKNGHVLVDAQQLADWGSPTYTFWVVMDNDIVVKPYKLEPFVNATLQMIKGYNQRKDTLTVKSKDIVAVSQLLKISPEDTLVLLKGRAYLGKREQSLVLARHLPTYLNDIGLFLRALNITTNVLPDYLVYIYPSFVDDAQVK